MQLGVHAVCYLLRCVVEHIATDLCFKTSTHLLWLVAETAQLSVLCYVYIKMVHISKRINIVLF